jgi:hypothetical protein
MANRVQNYLTLLPTISRSEMWEEKKEWVVGPKFTCGMSGYADKPYA